ncbi:hypothetical protein HYW74_01090 [Candidatus Pacearchaeota archaeon]|nr:hypothetical protein [Candidatus Pacearchaeota archaeon]
MGLRKLVEIEAKNGFKFSLRSLNHFRHAPPCYHVFPFLSQLSIDPFPAAGELARLVSQGKEFNVGLLKKLLGYLEIEFVEEDNGLVYGSIGASESKPRKMEISIATDILRTGGGAFTIAHEFGHYLKQALYAQELLRDLSYSGIHNARKKITHSLRNDENYCDVFANNLILPDNTIRELDLDHVSNQDILTFSKEKKVPVASIIGRLNGFLNNSSFFYLDQKKEYNDSNPDKFRTSVYILYQSSPCRNYRLLNFPNEPVDSYRRETPAKQQRVSKEFGGDYYFLEDWFDKLELGEQDRRNIGIFTIRKKNGWKREKTVCRCDCVAFKEEFDFVKSEKYLLVRATPKD